MIFQAVGKGPGPGINFKRRSVPIDRLFKTHSSTSCVLGVETSFSGISSESKVVRSTRHPDPLVVGYKGKSSGRGFGM